MEATVTTEEKAALLVGVFATVAIPVYLVLSWFLGAWVTCALWGWFVVPFGLPAIGYAHAFGLFLLGCVLCKNYGSTATEKATTQTFLAPVIRPLVLYIMGYFASGFVGV